MRMKRIWLKWLGLAWLLAAAAPAQALLSCTLTTASPLSLTYVSATLVSVASSVTISCTRTAGSDLRALNIQATDGLFPSALNNNARLNVAGFGNFDMVYNTYRDAACTLQFRNTASTGLNYSIPPGTPLGTPSGTTLNFWACIPASQLVASFPAGAYADTVTLQVYTNTGNVAVAGATTALGVAIAVPALCSMGTPPGNLAFGYTAFGGSDFQFTPFTAKCNQLLGYTLSVSPAFGTVAGLNYQLGLASTAGSATNLGPASLTDTGAASGSKNYVVNGGMAGGQAGDKTLPVSQSHILTIAY
jgi:Spore Coat Protein U domain